MAHNCPTCGSKVQVISSGEGTNRYEPVGSAGGKIDLTTALSIAPPPQPNKEFADFMGVKRETQTSLLATAKHEGQTSMWERFSKAIRGY